MLNLYNRDFWKEIKTGSTITLKDKQAIEDAMEKGKGVSGIDYMVKQIYRLHELNSRVQWNLFQLDDVHETLWMSVKMVEQEMDLRVYFEHPQFTSGNRKDMIDQGYFWLFKTPDNPDNFVYNDLNFASRIDIEAENSQVHVYNQKKFQEMHYYCTPDPVQKEDSTLMATLVEYQARALCDNPELLIFELGGSYGQEGGLIRLMPGCSIGTTEIDIL